MLKLNLRRRWIPWPEQGPEVRVLLSPLTSSRRAQLIEQATETLADPKKPGRKLTPRFNQAAYQQLVADECVHGWEGIVQADENDQPAGPLPYSREHAHALMEVDLFNGFVFDKIQKMGLEAAASEEAAGNGSGGAPTG